MYLHHTRGEPGDEATTVYVFYYTGIVSTIFGVQSDHYALTKAHNTHYKL